MRAVHAALGRRLSALLNCHGSFSCAGQRSTLARTDPADSQTASASSPAAGSSRRAPASRSQVAARASPSACIGTSGSASSACSSTSRDDDKCSGIDPAPARSRRRHRRSSSRTTISSAARRSALARLQAALARQYGDAAQRAVDGRPAVEQRKPQPRVDPRAVRRTAPARDRAAAIVRARWCARPRPRGRPTPSRSTDSAGGRHGARILAATPCAVKNNKSVNDCFSRIRLDWCWPRPRSIAATLLERLRRPVHGRGAPKSTNPRSPANRAADLVGRLARTKAEVVAATHPHAVVIGSDQLAMCGRRRARQARLRRALHASSCSPQGRGSCSSPPCT